MKKLLALLLAMMMVVAFAACDLGGNTDNPGGNTDNPGTSQGGEENPADKSVKADGAAMDADADHASKYSDIIALSGLEIGAPVGYACTGKGEAGAMEYVELKPTSGSYSVDDVLPYAAALWNLCIDNADGNTITNSKGKTYATLDKANQGEGIYVWFYTKGDNSFRLQIKPISGGIEVSVEPWTM